MLWQQYLLGSAFEVQINFRPLGSSWLVGILKNWVNQSLLTVEEIDSYQENQKPGQMYRKSNQSPPVGRDIPGEFVLDLTAGEEW